MWKRDIDRAGRAFITTGAGAANFATPTSPKRRFIRSA